ncbi:MAG: RNA polymerase factor sigma-54 [Verrucomicrobia bacterium]|nr:RNA polymerase factor sigma-54 [Verrucomicrobiota bacterium]
MADASLQQALNQQQTLTPQMRRSLEILQSNSMELSQMIHQAMEMNPVLEQLEEALDDNYDEEPDAYEEGDDLGHLNETDDDYRERDIHRNASNFSSDDEERRQFLYESIVAPETLQQFLARQVQQSIVPDEIKQIVMALIGNLNERGFLDLPPAELSERLQIKPSWMAQAVTLLQSFDPPGIGAVDLRDTLLIQLRRQNRQDSLEYKICEHHLNDLARRHMAQIAKALGTAVERINEATERISRLDPDPGGSFSPTSNPHITPDVIIRRTSDGGFEAELTNDHIPRLRISDFYKNLLAKTGSDKKALNYIRDNIRDGRSIISSISLRQETILSIAHRIIERQRPFLRFGNSKLRPMTMAEVGEDLGMHATTISRAVAGKYILTPHGMMEMRAFFATGYQTSSGAEFSNAAVREAIQSLINGENPAKPMSDDALTKELNNKGIEIKRRTVAKYREQLHILPSHLRKR